MSAGCKNRFITIKKLVKSRDKGGALRTNTPDERCKIWAERILKTGGETNANHQNTGSQLVDWVVWYRSDLKRTDRVVYEDVEYEIIDLQEVGFRKETRIFTRSISK